MPVFGLPKERILRGHKAFSDVIAKGSSLTVGSIRLFYVTSGVLTPTRAGFSTPRSIQKATVRNRIKRCLREAVRIHKALLPREKLTLVFMYRGAARKASSIACKEVEEDVMGALNRLREKLQT